MDTAVEEKLYKFFSKFPLIEYKKSNILLRPEDTPQGISYLSQGYVRIFFITKNGHEFTLNIFKPGSFFPLTWAISNIDNTYFYEAMSDIQILRAPKDVFLDFIRKDREILYLVSHRLLVGIDGITSRLEYLITGDARCKVANVLLMLSRRFGKVNLKNGHIKIDFNITQKDIAQLAGLTRETVCFEMKKLEANKSIKRANNSYIICNVKKLNTGNLISRSGVTPQTL